MAKIPVEPQTKLEYITCPLCGMNRKLDKTGNYARKHEARLWRPLGSKSPGRVRFDAMDLEHALILQVRDATEALRVVEGKTLAELAEDEGYAGLLAQMKAQIQKIQAILG